MNPTQLRLLLFTVFAVLFLPLCSLAGTITAVSSGSWSNNGTWNTGSLPGNGDDVVIPSGISVTLSSDVSMKSLSLDGSLDAGTYVLTIGASGSVTINGTFRTANQNGLTSGAFSATNSPVITLGSSSTIEFYGSGYQVITVRDYANLTISGSRSGAYLGVAAGTIGITGTFTHSATNVNYSNSGNTIQYKGSNQVVAATYPYYNLMLTGATGTTFPAGTVSISGTFTPSAIVTATQGTINFKGSGQTIPSFNYYNLDLSNASSVTFASGTVGVAGTFTPGYTTTATQGTINFRGSNQAIPAFNFFGLNLNSASGTTFPSGTVTISGTFTPGAIASATQGTINFKGNSQAVPAFGYNNLDLTGASGTTFASGTVAISGTFTPASITTATQGTIQFKGSSQTVPAFQYNNLSLTGATGTAFAASGTIAISGSFTPGTISSATQYSTLKFNGSTQTVPAFNYYHLDLTGATGTTFSSGSTGVAGTFTPASISSAAQGTFTFNGANQTVPAFSYYNLSLAGASNTSFNSGVEEVKGTFTPGTITAAGAGTIRYAGTNQTITAFNYFNLDISAATGISFPSGTVGIAGLFTPGSNTGTTIGTVTFNGSNQTVPAFNYNNLSLANASYLSFAGSGTVGIRGTFTPGYTTTATTGSTLNFNGSNQTVPSFGYYNLNLTGATGTSFATANYPGIDIYGTFTPGSITSATTGSYFNFKGASGQSIPAFNYYNVDLNNTSHSFPSGTMGIAGTFTGTANNSATQGTINFNGSNQSLTNNFQFFNLDLTGASNFAMTNYTVGVAGAFSTGSLTSAGTNYTLNFNGANQTVPAFTYYNLSLTGATGTGFANGTIAIGGAFTPGSLTAANQGTISYTGQNPVIQPITYYGLDISTPGTIYMTSGGTYTINGPFSVSANTNLNLNSWTATTFNIGGSLSYNATGGQSVQYLTLNLLNSGTLSGTAAGYSPNVTVASGATYSLSGNFGMTSGSSLTVNGTLTSGAYQVTGAGSVSVNTTGTIKVGGSTGLAGLIGNSGGYTFAAGARYEFNGSGAQSTGFSGLSMGLPASVIISNSTGDVTLDQDLTLGSGGQLIVSASGRFNAGTRSITVGSGGSVTVSGTFRTANTAGFSGSTSTTIKSTNNPTITLASGSTIDYTASSAQVVTARSDYYHLSLSNGQKTLAGATTLAGNIALSGSAKLLLGSYGLSVGGTMSGDASNYVVTNGSGSVVLRGITTAGKQFVIGASTSSYSPLTIKQGSSLDWTVNVASTITPSIATSSESIQRTWTITPSVNPTPSAAALTFQYDESEAGIKGATFNPAGNVTFKHYNGTAWQTATGNIAPTGSAGGVRTASASGFTHFSPWIVAQGGSVLPVQLLRFSGRRDGNRNTLSWATAQESNNTGFDVERATDGRNFQRIATVASRASGGNSSSVLDYQYSDAAGNGLYFYRLRQVDFDGHSTYSTVVRLDDRSATGIIAGFFPNPAGRQLQATLQSDVAQRAQLRIVDAAGRTVQARSEQLGAGTNSVAFDLSTLAPGTYLLQVFLSDGTSSSSRFQKD